MVVLFEINTTFLFSKRAGLNIGIATSIWSITPFVSAVLDWFINKTELKKYHLLGMTLMMVGALMMSLSNLLPSKDSTSDDDLEVEKPIPVIIPLLISASMPITCGAYTIFTRYATVTLKMDSQSWTYGFTLIYTGVFLLAGIINFIINPSEFSFSYAWQGGLGSLVNTLGCMLVGASIAT